MIFRSAITALAIATVSTCSSAAQDVTDQCVTAFKDNMTSVSTASYTKLVIEAVARNECRSDGTSINAGYSDSSQSLLGMASEALQITGSYNSTSEFCSAYKEGRINFNNSDSYDRKPIEAMAIQFNSCVATARDYRIALTSTRNGPGEVVYTGVFFRSGQASLTFNLNVSANGATCTLSGPSGGRALRGREITVENEFSVSCIREGREEGDVVLYKAADINLWFNGRQYPTSMLADRVFIYPEGPTSATEAKAIVDAARAEVEATKSTNAKLISEISILKNKVYYSRVAYVGEHNANFFGTPVVVNTEPSAIDGSIIHYSCDLRNYQGRRLDGRNNSDRKILGDRMANRVCGDSQKVKGWVFMGHQEGNNCGYDAYSIVCEK